MNENKSNNNAARAAGRKFKRVYGAQFEGSGHLIGLGYVPVTFSRRSQTERMIKGLRQCAIVELDMEIATGNLYWDSTDADSRVPEELTGNCQELEGLK